MIGRIGARAILLVSLALSPQAPALADDVGPEVLVDNQDHAHAIAADATHIYWVTVSDGHVWRMPKRGGAREALAHGQADPIAITVDATHVYWANQGDGSIHRVRKDGSAPEELARGRGSIADVQVDDTSVYWTDWGSGAVRRVSKTGGAPVTLARGQPKPWRLTVDESHVYWTNYGLRVYAREGEGGTGSVMRVPKAGGRPETLVEREITPGAIAVDGDWIYWLTAMVPTVRRMLKAGGPVTVLAENDEYPYKDLALDATHVYFVNSAYQCVMRVLKAGGEKEEVRSGPSTESSYYGDRLVVDDKSVYYTQAAFVVRTPKTSVRWVARATTPLTELEGIAADGTSVFWADRTANTIFVARGPSGAARPFLVDRRGLHGVAIDDEHVYWAEAPGSIWRAPERGGSPERVIQVEDEVMGVAVDATAIYFSTRWKDEIWVLDKRGGAQRRIVSGLRNVMGIAVDESRIYWTSDAPYSPAVFSVPKSGGVATHHPVALGSDLRPRGIAVDAEFIYVALEGRHGIARIAKTGGRTLHMTDRTLRGLSGVALSGGELFWTAEDGVRAERVLRWPASEEASTRCAPTNAARTVRVVAMPLDRPSIVGTDESFVYINTVPGAWRARRTGGDLERLPNATVSVSDRGMFYLEGDHVMILENGAASARDVGRAGTDRWCPPLFGQGGEVFAWNQGPPGLQAFSAGGRPRHVTDLAHESTEAVYADASFAYWAYLFGHRIMRAPRAGGAAEAIAWGQGDIGGITSDDEYVYWSVVGEWPRGRTDGMGRIVRQPLAGGEPETLATGLTHPSSPVIYRGALYWVDGTERAVSRIPLAGGCPATVARFSERVVQVYADERGLLVATAVGVYALSE